MNMNTRRHNGLIKHNKIKWNIKMKNTNFYMTTFHLIKLLMVVMNSPLAAKVLSLFRIIYVKIPILSPHRLNTNWLRIQAVYLFQLYKYIKLLAQIKH